MKRILVLLCIIMTTFVVGCSTEADETIKDLDKIEIVDLTDDEDLLSEPKQEEAIQVETANEEGISHESTETGLKYGKYIDVVSHEVMEGRATVTVLEAIFTKEKTEMFVHFENNSDKDISLFQTMNFTLVDEATGNMYVIDPYAFLASGDMGMISSKAKRTIKFEFQPVPEGIEKLRLDIGLFMMGYFGDTTYRIEMIF